MVRNHHRIFLQRIQRDLHRFFQLRVVAGGNRSGIILDFNVRGDAAIF